MAKLSFYDIFLKADGYSEQCIGQAIGESEFNVKVFVADEVQIPFELLSVCPSNKNTIVRCAIKYQP